MHQQYFGGFIRFPYRSEVQKYMRGDCAYFALALAGLAKQQIVMSREHFATLDNSGFYWDIRGKMNGVQFRDGLDDGELSVVSAEEVKQEMESGIWKCGFYSANRLTAARNLVKTLAPHMLVNSATKKKQAADLNDSCEQKDGMEEEIIVESSFKP